MQNQEVQVNGKTISLEDIDTELLASFEKIGYYRNMRKLDKKYSECLDRVIDSREDETKLKEALKEYERVRNARDYYKEDRLFAIRRALAYEIDKQAAVSEPIPVGVPD